MLVRSVTNPRGTSTPAKLSCPGFGFHAMGCSRKYIGSLNRENQRAPSGDLSSAPPVVFAMQASSHWELSASAKPLHIGARSVEVKAACPKYLRHNLRLEYGRKSA